MTTVYERGGTKVAQKEEMVYDFLVRMNNRKRVAL